MWRVEWRFVGWVGCGFGLCRTVMADDVGKRLETIRGIEREIFGGAVAACPSLRVWCMMNRGD